MIRVSSGLRAIAAAALFSALSGCGGCQEQQVAPPPPPVHGKLPPAPVRAAEPRSPAVPSCAVLALANKETGPAPLEVQLNAEGDCTEGEPSFGWTFGDGSPDEPGALVTHTFTKPGTYNPTARVVSSANSSLKDSDDVKIVVTAPESK